MAFQDEKPLILLYNPKVAHPGYQRLPHSLLQLGTLLEGRYPYALVDGNLDQERDRAAEIIEQVRRDGVRYLGVTIMPGPQLQQAVPDIKRIKAACPDLTVIVGGYFPTNHVNTCAKHPAIDYVVISAGEDTLLELVETLEAGGDPRAVAGLAFEREGQVIQTPKRKPHHPNELPWFPYHKVPVERYITKTHLGTRTLSHHSSFGCPFFCNFCAVVNLAEGKWLAESAERLGELAQYMVDTWQINALEFHDNNFFTSEKRVVGFC
ncbi:MAG TPA: cobalamin-dependent protein [Roseiflexaceae bacterium]